MRRLLLAGMIAGPLVATVGVGPVTYYRDVLPILQEHCLSCHRPGQIAPMSFISYRQTRPWLDAIRYVITTGKMPPWTGATPGGHWLFARDADTLLRWIDQGALEGDRKDAPPPGFEEEGKIRQLQSTGRAAQ